MRAPTLQYLYKCFVIFYFITDTVMGLKSYLIAVLIQLSLVTQSCPTLCDTKDCSIPGFLSITNSCSLLKLMSIESVMPSNHLILCGPLLLLPSIFPTIRVFSMTQFFVSGPQTIRVSFSIRPSNEYSELISFRMD